MKVLLAPFNNAGQPAIILAGLKRQGVEAQLLQYGRQAHTFNYPTDIVKPLRSRTSDMLEVVRWGLQQNFDIFHFWFRSLFYYPSYLRLSGIDIPLLKARGKRIVYRFTGFDLRLRSEDMRVNRYSPFHYGFNHGYNENLQKKYVAFLKEYVDQFVVQDPEMQSFLPEAKIIPRAINLDDWQYVGVRKSDCPLVIHAPSSRRIKGTEFVQAAVDELKREGLRFEYKEIVGMDHAHARQWYERADIVIDQLLIGWYGVLTLEAMALGKPVIVYIRENLAADFEHDLPLQNANPDTITNSLRTVIKDSDRRIELGQRARAFAEMYHDEKKVCADLINLYQEVLEQAPVSPGTDADIDYYEMQLKMMGLKPQAVLMDLRTKLARLKNVPHKKQRLLNSIKARFLS